jgi:hypothetical protein
MDSSRVLRLAIFGCATALVLAGCGHMPVMSMVKLARVDFVTTDPAGLRAAVKLPRSIRPMRDQVRLRLTVKPTGGKEDTQEFRLTEVSDPADILSLRDEIEGGTHLFAYRLEPAEAARLSAFRDAIKKQMGTGRGGSLTLAITPENCRSGELPAGPVLLTTYLRTAETGGYVPLARDVDMRSIMRGRDLPEEMPVCGQTG